MKIRIKTTRKDFADWVEQSLRFIGSGSFARPDDKTFELNVSPHHFGLLSSIVEQTGKEYRKVWAERFPETPAPKLKALYTIEDAA